MYVYVCVPFKQANIQRKALQEQLDRLEVYTCTCTYMYIQCMYSAVLMFVGCY